MNDLIYPEERRAEAIQSTLYQYLWDLYSTEDEDMLGERGVLGCSLVNRGVSTGGQGGVSTHEQGGVHP
ncbi:MAG: hypothetical protein QGF28_06925 [Candidatus Thalassarchaeaceae archaeon]|nr:hypothetical protein [Candidatus Thalassarchaeaceae archaeon]